MTLNKSVPLHNTINHKILRFRKFFWVESDFVACGGNGCEAQDWYGNEFPSDM
jgi:hypothetical protein